MRIGSAHRSDGAHTLENAGSEPPETGGRGDGARHVGAQRVGRFRGHPTLRLHARIGGADLRRLGRARPIVGTRTIRGPVRLAVNVAGDAIIAWMRVRRSRRQAVQYVVRRAGGELGAVRTIPADDVTGPALAVGVDPGGRAVVAYGRETLPGRARRLGVTAVDVRTGRARPETRVAPSTGVRGPREIAVGVAPRSPGQPIVVAWRGYPPPSPAANSVDTAATTLPASSDRLRAPSTLARGRRDEFGTTPRVPVRAVVDTAGRAVVAWSEYVPHGPNDGYDEDRSEPTVARSDAAGRFGPPQALDRSGTVGDLVAEGEGVAVGWLRHDSGVSGLGDPRDVVVARAGTDGRFAPAEVVDDRNRRRQNTMYDDGLQPPVLGSRAAGGLTAVYSDTRSVVPLDGLAGPSRARVSALEREENGETRVSVRPAG